MVQMQPVKMYTTAVCPYCIRAKQILKAKGVEQIEEIRVDMRPGGTRDHDGRSRSAAPCRRSSSATPTWAAATT